MGWGLGLSGFRTSKELGIEPKSYTTATNTRTKHSCVWHILLGHNQNMTCLNKGNLQARGLL